MLPQLLVKHYHLVQYFWHELLACRAGVNRHDNDNIKVMQVVIEPLRHIGPRIDCNPWADPVVNQSFLNFSKLIFGAGLCMHCNAVCSLMGFLSSNGCQTAGWLDALAF